MPRVFQFQKRIAIVPLILASIVIVSSIWAFIRIMQNKTDTTLPVDSTKLASIEDMVVSLSTRLDSVESKFAIIQEKLDEATIDPNNLVRISLKADIEQVSSEMKSLKDALGSDYERSLSVPFLRKDVEKIQGQLEERTAFASKEIDRIYDQNKWFIGLMFTMAIGLLGLAISNYLQTRKKETTPETPA